MSKCLYYLEKYLMGHPGKIVSLEKLKSLYADYFGENLNRVDQIVLISELKYSTTVKVINIFENGVNKTALCMHEKNFLNSEDN
ncbi:hypothetical protein [Enterococcus faecalis]|uniref:hypothetical protein n=1 Tax=Enterococcus faecalis TaxID=1351 RepID=UPI0026DC4446|nr:hypothetical protein [Enterococcus faecalis]NVJ44326.1 hypothetical protein [Enterococcus faecalis]